MRKFMIAFLSLTTYYLLLTTPAQAICPICTVGIGTGLGLTRYLGVDDTISGLWIGALILSSSFWLADWLKKKNFAFVPKFYTLYPRPYTLLIMYFLILLPLWFTGFIGHPFNTLLGIDKLIFGTILGSLVFLLALGADSWVRERLGHQLFVYQRVVFPLAFLGIISLGLFYLIP